MAELAHMQLDGGLWLVTLPTVSGGCKPWQLSLLTLHDSWWQGCCSETLLHRRCRVVWLPGYGWLDTVDMGPTLYAFFCEATSTRNLQGFPQAVQPLAGCHVTSVGQAAAVGPHSNCQGRQNPPLLLT